MQIWERLKYNSIAQKYERLNRKRQESFYMYKVNIIWYKNCFKFRECDPSTELFIIFSLSVCLFDIIFDMHIYLCCPDDSLKDHKLPRAWKLSRISASNKIWEGFIPQIQLTDNMTFVDPLQFKRVSWWDKGQSFTVRKSFWFWNNWG